MDVTVANYESKIIFASLLLTRMRHSSHDFGITNKFSFAFRGTLLLITVFVVSGYLWEKTVSLPVSYSRFVCSAPH